MSQKCRSCNAEIEWRKNEKSRQLAPIDAAPDDQGNIFLSADQETYEVLTGEELTKARLSMCQLHTNHFQKCPNKKQHRKPA
jgi:hypothetical protein